MPVGRPSIYSDELANVICSRISQGESLRAICREDKMPDMSTVMDWAQIKPEFSLQYTRATEKRADVIFEEIIEIADDGSNDWMEKQNKDGSTYTVLNHEHVQRSKLRCDARYWMLARMKPKKYGDKTVHQGDRENPIQVQHTHTDKQILNQFLNKQREDEDGRYSTDAHDAGQTSAAAALIEGGVAEQTG